MTVIVLTRTCPGDGVIDGRGANRMVFRVDRFGRGGIAIHFIRRHPAVPMLKKIGRAPLRFPRRANRRGNYVR